MVLKNLSLSTLNGAVKAAIDGNTLASVNDSTYTSDLVSLQVGSWQNAQFDNFSIAPAKYCSRVASGGEKLINKPR